MNNFTYSIPTTVFFGKGQVENLPGAIKQYGKKVLMVYGGGSIKKMGLYDKIVSLFKENGIEWVELNGVEPNPSTKEFNFAVKMVLRPSWQWAAVARSTVPRSLRRAWPILAMLGIS